MRLHLLSDLHLEFGPTHIPETDADVIVLAGDIHLRCSGHDWAVQQFPDKPVVYVLGNHEFYQHSLPDLTEILKRETAGSHIHLLENRAVEIGGWTFLGCTLWTDFRLSLEREAAMRTAEDYMSDYHVIEFGSGGRRLRPSDTVRLHGESVAWLREALAKCDPARTIVVTHHAPSAHSEAPEHATSPLRAAFASDLDFLVAGIGVPLWLHGHTHYNVDYMMGTTRVLTNQRGYPEDLCARFNPALVVEV